MPSAVTGDGGIPLDGSKCRAPGSRGAISVPKVSPGDPQRCSVGTVCSLGSHMVVPWLAGRLVIVTFSLLGISVVFALIPESLRYMTVEPLSQCGRASPDRCVSMQSVASGHRLKPALIGELPGLVDRDSFGNGLAGRYGVTAHSRSGTRCLPSSRSREIGSLVTDTCADGADQGLDTRRRQVSSSDVSETGSTGPLLIDDDAPC